MEWYGALILLLGTVCTLMFLGLPVALAFFAANIAGTYLFLNGDIGLMFMPMEQPQIPIQPLVETLFRRLKVWMGKYVSKQPQVVKLKASR